MDEDLGQAGDGPETVADLSQFLAGNSDSDPADDEADDLASDEPEEGNSDEATDAPADGEDDESKPEDDGKQQASDQKFKVTVKGDDGSDQTIEVDQAELVRGYQRQADYTRKTQALADHQRQAYDLATSKAAEFQQHYTREAQTVRAALHHLVGLRSPEEMAQLSNTDPSGWVAEKQREQTIGALITRIDQSLQNEIAQAQQIDRERFQASQQRMAEVLKSEGFDIPKMQDLAAGVTKTYGFSGEELRTISDPRLVRMMRDAVAFRELKAKAPEVTKKAKDAPKLPAPRRSAPQSERATKVLDQRFRSGRAGTKDLAAFIQQHERAPRR